METNAITGVNLNDPWVLHAYTRLISFKADLTQILCTFRELNPAQQRSLQGIAHYLNLEYEYTRVDRIARIGRTDTSTSQGATNNGHHIGLSHLHVQETPCQQNQESVNGGARLSHGSNSDTHSISEPSDLASALWSANEHTSTNTRGYRPSNESLQSVLDVSSPLGSQFTPYRASSRASSTSSLHSGHGRSHFRKTFGRRSSLQSRPSFQSQTSLQSRASSGYEEIVFEVNSGRLPSLSSTTRQRTSMDNVKKAAMLAVKKVGACWRCKFLRKTCDPDSPCQNCPKSKHQSDWHSVGCKRGTIVDKVARTLLCPNADKPAQRPSSPERRREVKDVKRKNKDVRRVTEERNDQVNTRDTINVFNDWLLEQTRRLGQVNVDKDPSPDIARLQPLVHSTLAIEWEIRRLNSMEGPHTDVWRQFVHEIYPWYPQFSFLLHSAAEYQSYTEQNQLIAQSLICVRNCLEVFRAQYCSLSMENPHARCSLSSGCKIECIAELDTSLTSYLEELGRVLFKKENMRSHDCWLSIFYSLCLQGYVRRLLCRISVDDTRPFPKEYLHLVVRLVSARFGSYDPFATLLSGAHSDVNMKFDSSHYVAQQAVNRPCWESRSISNPYEYLKGLCGDTAVSLDTDNGPQKINKQTLAERTQDRVALRDSIESIAHIELTDTTALGDRFMWFGEDIPDPFQDTGFYRNDWECDVDTFGFDTDVLLPELPTEPDMHPMDQSLTPYQCKAYSPDDLFKPQWVRWRGTEQQGWCGLCRPGQWLLLNDSTYIRDKVFNHGINPETGKHFEEPESVRKSSCDTWEAFCRTCLQWIPLYWDKDNSYFWLEHAYKVFSSIEWYQRMLTVECHTKSAAWPEMNFDPAIASDEDQEQTGNYFDLAIL